MATGFTKNFVVKNGITTGNITLDAGTGNITSTNLSVTGVSKLGAVGNVRITGGTSGQAIVTDGLGNLSFANASAASSPAPMPTYVAPGDTLTISANYQGLFGYPITIDGTMTVDGVLIDVNDNGNGGGGGGTATALNATIANVVITGGTSGYYLQTDGTGNLSWAAGGGGGGGSPGGINTQVQFNDAGTFGGNTGFTFNKTTGTLTSTYFLGAGNALSNIQGANVTGAVAFATTANAVAGANVSGAVQYSAVANSVDVANVSGIGNIATVNLTGSSSDVLYGNGIFAPVSGGGGGGSTISNGTSNVSIGTVNGNVTTSVGGTSNVLVITTTGANITGTLSSSGNVTAGNLVGPVAGGNSNISITTNANISMYVAGNANVRFVVTSTGANVNGTFSASGNANVGNLGTAGLITVTGNANVGNLGTAGLITATGNVRGANLVTPGVLSVTGNANVANLGVTGVFATTLSATGNINSGNLVTGGVLSVTGNANIGNLGTAGLITATGNLNAGNIVTAGLISATGNLNAGNIVTAGLISATGNITGGNLSVTGTVSANGITLGYLGAPFSGADVTSSYTLATPTNLGKIVSVGSGGSIVIPNAIFTSGDVVSVFNNTSANVNVTCSTTTAYIAGNNTSRSNVTLATRGLVTIVFISNSICVISGSVS